MLYLCYLFRALINSLVRCFLLYSQQKWQNNILDIQPRPLAAEQASKFPAQQYFELINPFNASQRHCPASAVLFQEQPLGDITVTRNAHFENYAGTDTGLPMMGQWSVTDTAPSNLIIPISLLAFVFLLPPGSYKICHMFGTSATQYCACYWTF